MVQTLRKDPRSFSRSPWAKWFVGGKVNIAYNCLDRHLETANEGKLALLCEGEGGEARKLIYENLYHEMSRFSNGLKGLGVKKGDPVGIYL